MIIFWLQIKMLRRVDRWHCAVSADFPHKKKNPRNTNTLVSLIANVAFITPSNGALLYENGTVSLGTQLKVSLFLSSLAVFAWPAASAVTERGGESNMAPVWGDAWERVYRWRRQEGGVLKWRENVFSFSFFWYRKDSHSMHFLPTLTTVPVHK